MSLLNQWHHVVFAQVVGGYGRQNVDYNFPCNICITRSFTCDCHAGVVNIAVLPSSNRPGPKNVYRLTTTGWMGQPDATARWNAPFLKGSNLPLKFLVPSGNISTRAWNLFKNQLLLLAIVSTTTQQLCNLKFQHFK